MNLLPEILNQAAARIAARRSPVQPLARPAPVPVPAPLDDEAALTSLVLHEAAIKLAYMGHCGRPGHRGGSRPKNQCGALPFGAARTGEVTRGSRSPNAYTVERSVQKKRGKADERITRVIYEKRRNPEEQRTWLKDAGIEVARAALTGVVPAAVLTGGLWYLGKNVDVGVHAGPATITTKFRGRGATATDDITKIIGKTPDTTPDVTPPPPSGQGSPPRPKKSPSNGRGSRNGARTSNGATKPTNVIPMAPRPTPQTLPSGATRPPAAVRTRLNDTLDRASQAPGAQGQPNVPKVGPKQALDNLDSLLTGLKQRRQGVWTLKGKIRKPKGAQWYEATLVNRRKQILQYEHIWDGKQWVWRKK
jgi:hypothetical protein